MGVNEADSETGLGATAGVVLLAPGGQRPGSLLRRAKHTATWHKEPPAPRLRSPDLEYEALVSGRQQVLAGRPRGRAGARGAPGLHPAAAAGPEESRGDAAAGAACTGWRVEGRTQWDGVQGGWGRISERRRPGAHGSLEWGTREGGTRSETRPQGTRHGAWRALAVGRKARPHPTWRHGGPRPHRVGSDPQPPQVTVAVQGGSLRSRGPRGHRRLLRAASRKPSGVLHTFPGLQCAPTR